MRLAGIIVAGGRGTRLGGTPKQWRTIGGRTLVELAADGLRRSGLAPIVLVHHLDDEALAAQVSDVVRVHGGQTRAGSVRAGLEALSAAPPDGVLIHDAARPCLSRPLVDRVARALHHHVGAAPAIAVTDALWRGDAAVQATVPRDGLWRAQTPQGFHFAPILKAHRLHGDGAADDVEVARRAGIDVAIVAGEEDNLKVTHPGDLERASRILEGRLDVRTGNGFDVHAFGEGDHVMLCGVRVPHSMGLLAHSDGDVGLHALTDAILGALATGDIGQHFPPSDPQWKGVESSLFLRHAKALADGEGYRLTHADVTIVCETPKIGPHAMAMRETVAGILGIEMERVSVKATTSERLGFTGRGEGIAAWATATLMHP